MEKKDKNRLKNACLITNNAGVIVNDAFSRAILVFSCKSALSEKRKRPGSTAAYAAYSLVSLPGDALRWCVDGKTGYVRAFCWPLRLSFREQLPFSAYLISAQLSALSFAFALYLPCNVPPFQMYKNK